MSIIAIGMNLMLAGLLTAALVIGYRLNGRLKALRDSHDGFAKAVSELDAAAARAEQGLADLRAATDEAHDALADRIEKARALSAKLDRQLQGAPPVSARAEPTRGRERDEMELGDVERVTHRLGSLLSAAREPRPERERFTRPAAAPVRERPRFDDDLFDIGDEPIRAGARR
ncbi:DUF6468 domain-containing protein [Phenylobacterium sp.]|uniref:DUF6468 domain-containing protein n=1 Tax=Phenylobacterium sp. TaxID=1871053 RepID=UPI0027374D79|nr:DUF6468 domain-containing protein [Phenylobacterium sp.]MDP3855904.1 DUF6468 domain-containing protein [Phenylobacterium sp.]